MYACMHYVGTYGRQACKNGISIQVCRIALHSLASQQNDTRQIPMRHFLRLPLLPYCEQIASVKATWEYRSTYLSYLPAHLPNSLCNTLNCPEAFPLPTAFCIFAFLHSAPCVMRYAPSAKVPFGNCCGGDRESANAPFFSRLFLSLKQTNYMYATWVHTYIHACSASTSASVSIFT
jgi:hypothetical protein